MMAWYGAGTGAGGWMFMGLFWVFLAGAIAWLVIELVRAANRHNGAVPALAAPPTVFEPTAATPLEVLDRRLADGQIDLATYQQIRAALGEIGGVR